MIISSPFYWMNLVVSGVLMVKRMINICGLKFTHIVIYARFENYVSWF